MIKHIGVALQGELLCTSWLHARDGGFPNPDPIPLLSQTQLNIVPCAKVNTFDFFSFNAGLIVRKLADSATCTIAIASYKSPTWDMSEFYGGAATAGIFAAAREVEAPVSVVHQSVSVPQCFVNEGLTLIGESTIKTLRLHKEEVDWLKSGEDSGIANNMRLAAMMAVRLSILGDKV